MFNVTLLIPGGSNSELLRMNNEKDLKVSQSLKTQNQSGRFLTRTCRNVDVRSQNQHFTFNGLESRGMRRRLTSGRRQKLAKHLSRDKDEAADREETL